MKLRTLFFFTTLVVCLIINENFCSGAFINSENDDSSPGNGNEKVPASARKAGGGGGGGRKNRVETTLAKTESQPIAPSDIELTETKDVVPVRARKAGGGRQNKNTPKPQQKPKEEEPTISSEYSNESKEEERGCTSDKEFFHIRGKQCVPLKCPFGRDVETGQCFDRYGGLSNGKVHRWGSNAGSRPKTNQKTFGLGRFGIRAGGKKGR